MRHWMLGLSLAALGAPMTSHAAETADAVARGLEAQYQAALIRERRLADDRETQLISAYEGELREARMRFDAGGAGAEARLAEARTQYAALVEQVALRDAASRAEIEAYRAEAWGMAQRANPDLLQAYGRFADGDRVGAWPVIEALTQAQVRAAMTAASARAAGAVRDLARARETMRINGEATISDVLELWRQAVALDPNEFTSQIEQGRLAGLAGNRALAEASYRGALAASSTPRHRAIALAGLANEVHFQGDRTSALAMHSEAKDLFLGIAEENQHDVEAWIALRRSYSAMANVNLGLHNLEGAVALAGDGVGAGRRAIVANPENDSLRDSLGIALTSLGTLQIALGDLEGGRRSLVEQGEIARSLFASAPANLSYQRNVMLSFGRLRFLARVERNGDAERAAATEELAVARMIQSKDTGNSSAAQDLRIALNSRGSIAQRDGDEALAFAHYAEALRIACELALAFDVTPSELRDVQSSMSQLTALDSQALDWRGVVQALDPVAQRGVLEEADVMLLNEFRRRAGSLPN